MHRIVVVEQLHEIVLRGVAKAPYGVVAREFRPPVISVDLTLGPEVAGDVTHRIAGVDDREDHVVVVAEVQAPRRTHWEELVVVEGESAPFEVRVQEGAFVKFGKLHDAQFVIDLLARIERKKQVAVELGFGVGRGRRQQVHASEGFEGALQRMRGSPA